MATIIAAFTTDRTATPGLGQRQQIVDQPCEHHQDTADGEQAAD